MKAYGRYLQGIVPEVVHEPSQALNYHLLELHQEDGSVVLGKPTLKGVDNNDV